MVDDKEDGVLLVVKKDDVVCWIIWAAFLGLSLLMATGSSGY